MVEMLLSKLDKDLVAVIKDTAYKRITENVLSEFAFELFINTYGEDIGELDAFCQRDESIFNVYWKGVDEASLYAVEVYKSHYYKFITSKITMPEETRGLCP